MSGVSISSQPIAISMEHLRNLILYIDDESDNLLLFRSIFSDLFEVFTAESTTKAEQLIQKHQFKVIISDISMPEESGLDFFTRVHFKNYEPILIILTAHVNNELLLKALHQGKIYRYLTKPWNVKELTFTIEQAIQTFDLHYQNRQLFNQIKDSELKFHNIFNYSQDAIIIFSYSAFILEANKAFLNAVKKEADEITKYRITDFLNDEVKTAFMERVKELTNSDISMKEYKLSIPALGERFIEANSCIIDYKGEDAILSIIRDITDRKQHERAILNAVIEAEEKERSRIAKDLHDGLGPILATLNMYLEWLKEKGRIEQHPDILELSTNSVREAIVTLKNISNNLSPHMLEKFGLVSAITSFVELIKKVSSVKFVIDSNIAERLIPIVEISLYRIVTECINNTLKHSKSTEINIKLHKQDNKLKLTYSDNGQGFNIHSAMKGRSGMGLHNIQNRISTLGGKVMFESSKESGTRITAEITI